MNSSAQKMSYRDNLPIKDLLPSQFGKLAEQIRRIDNYRDCKQIFMVPGAELIQARINALLDQKELIVASAGLKNGFYRFRPNKISFAELKHAVTLKGIEKYGERIPSRELGSLDISIIIVDSEAIDGGGLRIGDGLGYADLAVGILKEYGSLAEDCMLCGVVAENRRVELAPPQDLWDVKLGCVVSVSGIDYISSPVADLAGILWDELPAKKIKKIQPLWDMYSEKLHGQKDY